jgi:hypothetical protein
MVASLLWIAGIALELLILFRLLKCRLAAHYPFFFAYMIIVCLFSIALWPIYQFRHSLYPQFYWANQFLNLLAGFGVLFEIVQKSFRKYPGARNFATTVLAVMFAILCGYFVFRLLPMPPAAAKEGFSSLERDFRTVQALTLCGVLIVISYYRIDIGRNLRGIMTGLGLYVGSTILSRALRGYIGPAFDGGWNAIQPYTYLAALLVWTFTLWSYAPAPAPEMTAEIDNDYEAFAGRTEAALGTMRTAVNKVNRQ